MTELVNKLVKKHLGVATPRWTFSNLIDFADDYHRQKVEAWTDEQIEKWVQQIGEHWSDETIELVCVGAKYLRDEQLK